MEKYKVIKPFVCQDRKKRFSPGDIYTPLSDFEKSRNTAEKNIVPAWIVDVGVIEKAVETPPEKRRGRKRKNVSEANNSSNG